MKYVWSCLIPALVSLIIVCTIAALAKTWFRVDFASAVVGLLAALWASTGVILVLRYVGE